MLIPLSRTIPFGARATPFSVLFEENQVANRQFIELGGYLPADMLTARNNFERFERGLDHAFYNAFAVLVPVILGRVLLKRFDRKLLQQFKLPTPHNKPINASLPWIQRMGHQLEKLGNRSAIQVPLEWLERSGSFKVNQSELARISENLGFKSPQELSQLLKQDAFKKSVLGFKAKLIAVDLALMAFNAQFKLWVKNLVTARWSGKEGFSGTYKYATDDYLHEKSKSYNQHKYQRLALSLGMGLFSIATLPLAVYGLMRSPSKVGKGLMGTLKKLTPAFNYADSIFMSRYILLWYSMFNYILVGALSARDSNERREHLVKSISLDFFFAFGDPIVAGLSAKALEKANRSKLNATKLSHTVGGLPVAKSLREVLEQVKQNPKHPAYQLALKNYWGSLITTTLLVGVSIPLINNYYTRKKVLAEQASLQAKNNTHQPPTPQPSVSLPSPTPTPMTSPYPWPYSNIAPPNILQTNPTQYPV